MSKVIRFGVSIDSRLLDEFDNHIKEEGYETRSKAISDLIESNLRSKSNKLDGMSSGAIIYIYDHSHRDIVSRLIDIQHDYHDIIISMQHVHIDHDNCLEIVTVNGKAIDIDKLYNRLKTLKNIKRINIILT